ncbi:DEAD/DEAH box helicase [Ramlibacter algicola]|uniref:Protein translocase subunit SecA n=1 Tax=Ramlibacter algicola TaxID=2795217 RepID=A0A934Q4R7_9BURK|nr:DEAD/DEAH box helicase [Ramlibacter algicola]MBK0394995.1 prepilin peptidase [Ramlibacter algicola]
MSSQAALFRSIPLAGGRPYVERADEEPGWHDRLALSLDGAVLSPLRTRVAGWRGELQRVVEATDRAEQALRTLPDEQLREHARGLRARLRRQGLTLANVADSFAVVRCAAERTLGQRHYDSQLMAGYTLLRGRLAEMATGEGKTFAATLPACTMALAGYPVHVITVNDYLAQRDADKMRPLYAFFGLDVGVVVQGMERPDRRRAYALPITYATNKELAFDYLRDRVAVQGRGSRLHHTLQRLAGQPDSGEGTVLRGLYFAIVDEADSVFVDEARTPLILSASTDGAEDAKHGALALEIARTLDEGEHYRVRADERAVTLTELGRARVELAARERTGPWTSVRGREEMVRQALSALHLYVRDQQYVVLDGKVQIVDESTGRLMPDRSWERGLHQMIELKESVPPTARRETLARLTYQRLFRRYLHLSGMTGTAAEAAEEMRSVYGLDMARIPLHRPSRRIELPAVLCATLAQKWRCVADQAQQLAAQGRAVLIGTRSVQASEEISALLRERGLDHALLNAKQDADEAAVIAAAGQAGRITVATNMAGRGTDIELDPDVEQRGGLHVILTEYHDTARVDRQLVGRCARQGDPGSCIAIVSLEDEIFQVQAPWATALVQRCAATGHRVPAVVHHALRALAQWSSERRQAAIRVQNLKQDRQLHKVLAFSGKGE